MAPRMSRIVDVQAVDRAVDPLQGRGVIDRRAHPLQLQAGCEQPLDDHVVQLAGDPVPVGRRPPGPHGPPPPGHGRVPARRGLRVTPGARSPRRLAGTSPSRRRRRPARWVRRRETAAAARSPAVHRLARCCRTSSGGEDSVLRTQSRLDQGPDPAPRPVSSTMVVTGGPSDGHWMNAVAAAPEIDLATAVIRRRATSTSMGGRSASLSQADASSH